MNEINKLKQLTKKYLIKYDYEKVIQCCNKLLENKPKSRFALRFKGISYMQMERYDKALQIFEKLYTIDYNNNETLNTLAYLNEKLRNYDKALDYYSHIIKRKGQYNDYNNERKRKLLLIDLKRYDTLIQEYDDQLDTLENNDRYSAKILGIMEEKAVIQYMNNQYDESYDTFKKIASYWPEVKKIRTNPLYHSYWYVQLNEYLEKFQEKEEFFRQIFKNGNAMSWESRLKRNLSSADEYVMAEVLIRENPGNIDIPEMYANETKYYLSEYALRCFYKILESDPYNKGAINSIINIYSEEYSKDKALKLINSKLENIHLRSDLLKQKIKLLESMTLYPEALETYHEYFKHATRSDKELTSMKIDYLICMEVYALDLYNQDKLDQSYNILKDAYNNFKKINNYHGEQLSIAWYTDVLKDNMNKSDDNPKEFFNNFYTPDDKQTKIWIKKIDSIASQLEPQKLIGNKTYYDILIDKNNDNIELAISEARKYYYGIQRPSIALPLYNRVLKIDPDNKEVLNHKFSMLLTARKYDEAYNLLTKMEIDFPVIAYSLRELAEFYIENKEYERAKYCLNLILSYGLDYKILNKLKYVWDKSNDTKSQNECPYYMEWINLIDYKHEENTCPYCGDKLIPIRYGVIMRNDSGFKTGKYYASEDIKIQKHRPTDYCNKCKKEIYLGFCGINLIEDNIQLSWYTKQILIWLIKHLEENKQISIKELEKAIYKEFSINKEECEALLIKLETINFVEHKKDTITLWGGYTKFKNSLDEMYHFRTNIFKNKKELQEYSNTIRNSKEYSNIEDYIEDVKICLMTSGWHYTYESATRLLEGDERDLRRGHVFEADAWSTAIEEGFVGG